MTRKQAETKTNETQENPFIPSRRAGDIRRPAQAPSLGVRFTDEEEKAIRRAMRDSIRYMATYGQGREPYMLDRRNYVCGKI